MFIFNLQWMCKLCRTVVLGPRVLLPPAKELRAACRTLLLSRTTRYPKQSLSHITSSVLALWILDFGRPKILPNNSTLTNGSETTRATGRFPLMISLAFRHFGKTLLPLCRRGVQQISASSEVYGQCGHTCENEPSSRLGEKQTTPYKSDSRQSSFSFSKQSRGYEQKKTSGSPALTRLPCRTSRTNSSVLELSIPVPGTCRAE